jgi:hypothetical protein
MIEQIANAPIEEESPGRRLTHLWLISRDMATTSNSAQDSPVLRFDTLLQRVACDFALHLRFISLHASDPCISQFANASKLENTITVLSCLVLIFAFPNYYRIVDACLYYCNWINLLLVMSLSCSERVVTTFSACSMDIVASS